MSHLLICFKNIRIIFVKRSFSWNYFFIASIKKDSTRLFAKFSLVNAKNSWFYRFFKDFLNLKCMSSWNCLFGNSCTLVVKNRCSFLFLSCKESVYVKRKISPTTMRKKEHDEKTFNLMEKFSNLDEHCLWKIFK